MQPLTLNDIDEVEQILGHPSVFNFCSDDSEITALDAACACLRDPSYIVIKPHDDTLFLFKAMNKIMYEMHVCIVRGKARKQGIRSAAKAARWLFNNTQCQKIVTHIPVFNELSLMFAMVCGMKREGLIKGGYLKDGKLYDLILLGSESKDKQIELINNILGEE